jgi:hypothetical protein
MRTACVALAALALPACAAGPEPAADRHPALATCVVDVADGWVMMDAPPANRADLFKVGTGPLGTGVTVAELLASSLQRRTEAWFGHRAGLLRLCFYDVGTPTCWGDNSFVDFRLESGQWRVSEELTIGCVTAKRAR